MGRYRQAYEHTQNYAIETFRFYFVQPRGGKGVTLITRDLDTQNTERKEVGKVEKHPDCNLLFLLFHFQSISHIVNILVSAIENLFLSLGVYQLQLFSTCSRGKAVMAKPGNNFFDPCVCHMQLCLKRLFQISVASYRIIYPHQLRLLSVVQFDKLMIIKLKSDLYLCCGLSLAERNPCCLIT